MIPLAKPAAGPTPGLAVRLDPAHIGRHGQDQNRPASPSRCIAFAQDDWQIESALPGAVEVRHIKGFKTKTEVDEWADRKAVRIDWLRSQGYAKVTRRGPITRLRWRPRRIAWAPLFLAGGLAPILKGEGQP